MKCNDKLRSKCSPHVTSVTRLTGSYAGEKSVQATKVSVCLFLHMNAGPQRSETSGPSGTEIAGELLTSRTSRILRLFYKISFTTFYFIVLLLPGYTMLFWILELT